MTTARYCEVCGRRVPESEIESGEALLNDGGVCCAAHKRIVSLYVNYLKSDAPYLPESRFSGLKSRNRLNGHMVDTPTPRGSSRPLRDSRVVKRNSGIEKARKTAAGIAGISAVLIIVVLSLVVQTLMSAGSAREDRRAIRPVSAIAAPVETPVFAPAR